MSDNIDNTNNEDLGNNEENLLSETLETESTESTEGSSTEDLLDGIRDEAIEDVAKSTGHLSKEEWIKAGRRPEEYKTEKEFVLTGEVIEMKKLLKKSEEQIASLVKYNERVKEREYANARKELENNLQLAKERGDVDNIERFAQEKLELDQIDQNARVQRTMEEQAEVDRQFMDRNKHWFNDQHKELKDRAVQMAQEEMAYLQMYNLPVNYGQIASKVESRMRFEYPTIAGVTSKPVPVVSQTRSSEARASAGYSSVESEWKQLNKDDINVYEATRKMLDKQGIKYTKDMFIKKLKQDGEI